MSNSNNHRFFQLKNNYFSILDQYFSLEQYKNQKELEEGRKAGKIKAKIDVDGKEINPHMPQFITEAPWYLNQQSTSMKHQYFSQKSKPETEEFYARGQKGFQATKYRKGACTNCGALTHQQKDCCQRPRMKGAAITNKDIAADDIIKDIQFTYDSKHFNWNGYNPEDYMETVKEKERIEELRKQLKEDEGEVGESNKQTTKYDDGTRQLDENVGEQIKGNNKQLSQNSFWTTTSQRIREDIAKYLINYNSDSVYYNPKCRSMRENPTPNDPNAVFEGENELRNTGGAAQFLKQEIFAWHSAQQNGQDLNCISNPTLTEKVFKQMQQYQSTIKAKYLQKILKDYGEDNHLNEDLNLILRQTEKYVEFTVDGSLQQSQKLYQSRQKYLEDQYFNNHTTIWGSFFSNFFGWGYGCCHSNVKNSMCLGERGKQESEKREVKQ